MAKNKEQEVVFESKWDGRLLTYIGKWILQLLVLGIFAGVGLYLGCMNVVGGGGAWYEDIQDPTTLALVVVGAILCGIGFCWFCIIGLKYDIKHRVVCGYRMKLKASTWNLFWNCVKWTFLTVITLGIYALWIPVKVKKWACKHTVCELDEEYVEEEEEEEEVLYPITYYTVDDDGNYEEMIIEDEE